MPTVGIARADADHGRWCLARSGYGGSLQVQGAGDYRAHVPPIRSSPPALSQTLVHAQSCTPGRECAFDDRGVGRASYSPHAPLLQRHRHWQQGLGAASMRCGKMLGRTERTV